MIRSIALILILFVVAVLIGLTGCWSDAPEPREGIVPAAEEAARLRATEPPAAAEVRELRTQELEAATAAAKAEAGGDAAAAAYQHRLATALATLRTAAEAREQQQRQQIAALAADADHRAQGEQAELDRRAAAAEHQADLQRAEEQRLSDRRWAGWGLALAAVAAIALRVIGMPGLIAFGIPAAIGGGCLTLAAWSSVPWLATVLGLVLAAGLLIALALLARRLVQEWLVYATHLQDAQPQAKPLIDAASRARQPAWLRWIIDHLLRCHRASPAAATTTAPQVA
jgi:hypothetical protein